ncbi:MAG TPA: HEAT repeat domain-containing protein [Vicinamibacteria bacterium]|nr:HEAT repeat domain-containing protein [Vicinamibacteria bacterium]
MAAFLALFGSLAAHTILETGRDALFLGRLPAQQLPWMYLAMAALAVFVARARAGGLASGRRLPALTVACAVGTLAFWAAGSEGPWSLRALYVWTGLVATVLPVAFWLLLSEIFTIAQARRLYPFIALASPLGAMVGAAVARVALSALDARHLIAGSAAILLLTALGPSRCTSVAARGLSRDALPIAGPRPLESQQLWRHAYLVRVAGLVLLSTIAFTLGDYVFKSAVAEAVEPARLGTFFATAYLLLNALAILVQVLLSGSAMRLLGVDRALAVLPLLVLPSALGVALGAGLAGAVLLKGVDGALRASLNRVGIELLFVPLPVALRAAAKPAIDVFGARGGQALASAVILAAIAWGGGTRTIAATAVLTCIAWALVALTLRPLYLSGFRAALERRFLPDGASLPSLDLRSFEAVLAALNSRDDGEVLAALELLLEQGRDRVVPALLLHHPSKPVVLRMLQVLTERRRTDWLPIAERLLRHDDPEIRAAALRAQATAKPEQRLLLSALEDASPLVRATALVGLVAAGSDSADVRHRIRELADSPSVSVRAALAEAIERQPSPAFEEVLLQLARSHDARANTRVPGAMAKLRSPAFLPTLVGWLGVRDLRDEARRALLAYGTQALDTLDEALADPRLPARVREHIPRTISLFPPQRAVSVLQRHLSAEQDGKVRFKILRGLGRIAADHPDVRYDDALLREAASRAAAAAVEALHFRVSLIRGAGQAAARITPAHRLLVSLLRDKERHRVERLFRILQLRFRSEDLRAIHRGLGNADRRVVAASLELLRNLVDDPLRETLMALVDDLPDAERLARIPGERRLEADYRDLLASMVETGSSSLRSLAAFHARELGFEVGDPIILPPAVVGRGSRIQEHAVGH